jgi:RNA polymerase sigma-70 factor (ECF subfamily)
MVMNRDIDATGTPADAEVLATFRRGDLAPFYRHVYPVLLLFAERLLGEQAAFLAEDCVQDAVFDAWRGRERFVSLASLKGFLYTAIRHDAVSLSRRERARRRYIGTREEDVFFHTAVVDAETLALLRAAIGSLPGREREVLEMSYVEGLKIEEIAGRLCLSGSSIKKYKTSAIRLLRQRLAHVLHFFFIFF